ncbi:hypothetical protein FHU38_001010 [Saccharomonospora amisosensis]|uniref:Uncharacterized protein n=1 Tax=Saccharomonospora amisosensis TaxID=1128677 RepID=A0A7X5UMC6_9PSEU|nr:hypothetical protein [Saccharomonospora amisosensis]NIJ10666.1 hypothetical protein [Saccharomonospora amisosensis]
MDPVRTLARGPEGERTVRGRLHGTSRRLVHRLRDDGHRRGAGFNSAQQLSLSGGEVHEAAEEAARALASDEDGVLAGGVTFDSFQPYVEDAVRESATAKDNAVMLRVTRADDEVTETEAGGAQQEGDQLVEHYVVTGDGDEQACLTVTGTNLGEHASPYPVSSDAMPATYSYQLSASVSDGAC